MHKVMSVTGVFFLLNAIQNPADQRLLIYFFLIRGGQPSSSGKIKAAKWIYVSHKIKNKCYRNRRVKNVSKGSEKRGEMTSRTKVGGGKSTPCKLKQQDSHI